MPEDIQETDKDVKRGGLSRREFLKLTGAGLLVAGSAVVARERLRFASEHEIDMSNYLVKIPDGDEYSVNFTALSLLFPDIVKKSEHGGFILKNPNEDPIVLDFGGAAGKEIRLAINKVEVALSNIPWGEPSFGVVSAGLALEGAFKIKGDIGRPPVFIGDVLDRIITFKGSGKESCSVEDIKLQGLNAFKQGENGDSNCPSPAFIAGDDVNLEVQGIKIDYIPAKPEWANEENSQLAKGIVLHNTRNTEPLRLSVVHSLIKGLQWDGIYSNGWTMLSVDKSILEQEEQYFRRRGVGIVSTFNASDGRIEVADTSVRYAKGVGIWTGVEGSDSKDPNIRLRNTSFQSYGWALKMEPGQRVKSSGTTVHQENPAAAGGLVDWPVVVNFSGDKVEFSFDTLRYECGSSFQDTLPLIAWVNVDNYEDFAGVKPSTFFRDRVERFGDLVVSRVSGERTATPSRLTRDKFLKFLSSVEAEYPDINPGVGMLIWDARGERYGVQFGAGSDAEHIYLCEPLWISNVGEGGQEAVYVRQPAVIAQTKITRNKGDFQIL